MADALEQPKAKTIKLSSEEKAVVEVDYDVIKLSKTINNMLKVIKKNNFILFN